MAKKQLSLSIVLNMYDDSTLTVVLKMHTCLESENPYESMTSPILVQLQASASSYNNSIVRSNSLSHAKM